MMTGQRIFLITGRCILVLFALMTVIGLAGFKMPTSWENDSGNWQRIFHTGKPYHIGIIHSRYVRSPDSEQGFKYFLEIEHSDWFLDRMLQDNELRRMESTEDLKPASDVLDAKPPWFVPEDMSAYEVWYGTGKMDETLMMFEDMRIGNIFLAGHRL